MHGSEVKRQIGRRGLTGISLYGTPWFVQPSETGRTVCLETMNALQALWPMHMAPDQARALAGAIVEIADEVELQAITGEAAK